MDDFYENMNESDGAINTAGHLQGSQQRSRMLAQQIAFHEEAKAAASREKDALDYLLTVEEGLEAFKADFNMLTVATTLCIEKLNTVEKWLEECNRRKASIGNNLEHLRFYRGVINSLEVFISQAKESPEYEITTETIEDLKRLLLSENFPSFDEIIEHFERDNTKTIKSIQVTDQFRKELLFTLEKRISENQSISEQVEDFLDGSPQEKHIEFFNRLLESLDFPYFLLSDNEWELVEGYSQQMRLDTLYGLESIEITKAKYHWGIQKRFEDVSAMLRSEPSRILEYHKGIPPMKKKAIKYTLTEKILRFFGLLPPKS